jgi:HSP20 family protein
MLTAWNAVSTLDRIFDDVMGSAFGTAMNSQTFDPAIDVLSTDAEVRLLCDVPGVKQEDLDLTLENHVLTVKGKRSFESPDTERVVLGRAYGAFSRSFSLPEGLDEEKLSAELTEGVLTIRIPRHPKAMPRKISIGGSSEAKQLKA